MILKCYHRIHHILNSSFNDNTLNWTKDYAINRYYRKIIETHTPSDIQNKAKSNTRVVFLFVLCIGNCYLPVIVHTVMKIDNMHMWFFFLRTINWLISRKESRTLCRILTELVVISLHIQRVITTIYQKSRLCFILDLKIPLIIEPIFIQPCRNKIDWRCLLILIFFFSIDVYSRYWNILQNSIETLVNIISNSPLDQTKRYCCFFFRQYFDLLASSETNHNMCCASPRSNYSPKVPVFFLNDSDDQLLTTMRYLSHSLIGNDFITAD